MVNGASYDFRQTRRFCIVVDIDTARRCSGEDVDDVDDVVRSRVTETRVGKRLECSHSYDH